MEGGARLGTGGRVMDEIEVGKRALILSFSPSSRLPLLLSLPFLPLLPSLSPHIPAVRYLPTRDIGSEAKRIIVGGSN